MSDLITRLMAVVSPERAVRRQRARLALQHLMHYEAATTSKRATWRPVPGGADVASDWVRNRLAWGARDLVRNNAWARRAVDVITAATVGDGIIPKAVGGSKRERDRFLSFVEAHCDTAAIDADGRTSLYGLQALVMRTVVESGECLVRHRPRRKSDGLPLPFQLQVLEPEYLDTDRDGETKGGGWIKGGIEFDHLGRRVAYWLHSDHPADYRMRPRRMESKRVPTDQVAHIYRVDRPGQTRGVSWLATVAMALQDLHDFEEAQLVRAKIAACFAAFRIPAEGEKPDDDNPGGLKQITPGRIHNVGPGEDIKFADPPTVGDFEPFVQVVLRAVAAGMGLTYEALSGDLRQANYSSARMGRLEMDRIVSAIQWQMLVPQLCEPIGRWLSEAITLQTGREPKISIEWVPPYRELVDPPREIKALVAKVRAGFASRSQIVREFGYDPERVVEEIERDAKESDEKGLVFDSDPRRVSVAGQLQDQFQEGT